MRSEAIIARDSIKLNAGSRSVFIVFGHDGRVCVFDEQKIKLNVRESNGMVNADVNGVGNWHIVFSRWAAGDYDDVAPVKLVFKGRESFLVHFGC